MIIIVFANSLWIHYQFRKFTLNPFFRESTIFSRFHIEITILFPKSPSIHCLFREINLNSLSPSRFHNEFTVFFANPLWIHVFSPNHYGFTICYAISLWTHYLFYDNTINTLSASRFYYKFTMDTLLISQIHFKFTIFFAKSLYIHYRFREFTICFANSLLNCYLFREFTIHQKSFRGFGLNQLLFPRINSDFIIYFTNSIWICSFYSESFTYYDSFT